MVNTTTLSPLMECPEQDASRSGLLQTVAGPPIATPPNTTSPNTTSGTGRTPRTRLRWRRGRQAAAVPRLYQATDAAGDGLWDWDMASGAVWYSPRWQTMLGFTPDEVPPHVEFWRSRVHPDDLPLVEAALAAHLSGERPVYECEHRVRTKSGAWLWILDRGRVMSWDAERRPSRMIGTHVDITARKRIEEELAESRLQLDAILDNAPVGVLLVDRDRVIRRVNKSVAATFQHRLEDIVGCSARVIYGDDGVFEEVGRRAYPRMEAGGQFDEEVVMRRADGADIRCRLIGRSVKAGDPARGYVWVVEDVTVRWRAEQALNDRAGFQRVLLDTVPVPIFVQDVMGHYVDANSAFERWMGIDRQALFGRTVFDLAPPHIAEADGAVDKALLADQKPQSYETQLRYADGTLRDVLFSKAVYCRTGGKPAGIVGAVMDISERKHAEQALLERQQLFEQIFVASCAVKLLVDPADGRIVDANPAAAEFYGYPLDRLRSMHIQDINAAPRTEVERDLHHAGSAGQRHFQFRHRLASGEFRDVEVYISNIVVHGRTMLMSLIHDITERCLAADALRRKTLELERSNAELEAFAYVASHDLRQPLRVITSYLTLLERGLGTSLDEEGRECIDFARDGAQRMDRLIVDLLEYSRVGRKAKPFRPVPLEEPLRLALLNLEVAVQDAGATVTVGIAGDGAAPAAAGVGMTPTVTGDDNELMRLFQNLIGNAVKYREPGRPPIVRVAVAADRQDGVAVWRIDIRDNGIGIAAEDRERVFGIFQRLHRRDEYEGTGVGLAVCKKIVEHHGGRLWVDDLPGDDLRGEDGRPCGSLFRMVLPALDGQGERGGERGGEAPSPQ
ncbi:PAS domain S-box protein [Azospirillum sp. A1-3]|uniref:PAS domain-containing sensor histidine kinase n=1 Tax=Azospirillum sp. A1-3 TaxID=185874 RepID=UPI002076D612|nr:PAS domain S-box protein [Azospirillum sp. A1-3]MCM8733321.1 PAS domain S-box protein [Azospirillum sp. A1-3]